jgi:hypothetical protein
MCSPAHTQPGKTGGAAGYPVRRPCLAVCCASCIKPSKSAYKALFTLQTAKAGRIIGIFALLMAQKSTSATGCYYHD